ncbi:hypothetical protein U14_05183 [Candidatus Moduliflexus flocculans]|uniref:Uncharacterized protein n=1 Tax=Candidatus Moduliflexus flocculans TaxID=1499966 RepID=A0A081BR77_9BACT|nr:hypothetical protein U14_05183 [Candidatus Moduliflexus flocculans]
MLLWIAALIVFCCVVCEGFFSGSEIAIISVDKIKLRHLASVGSKGAMLAQKMLQQPERFLGTTLVGTNLSVVISSVTLTTILSMSPEFTHTVEFYVAVLLTPIALVFGEIVPKSVFQQHAETIVPIIARPLHLAFRAFYPIVFVVTGISGKMMRVAGIEKKQRQQTLTREELKFLLHSDQGAIADQQRKEMMQRVFDFRNMTVEDIMVPLVDVRALEKGTTIETAIEQIHEHGFSRIPIYEERVDHLVGVIHAFDLLRAPSKETTIDRFIRKAYYVPDTMLLADFIKDLQRHHTQIAIVVNEYGGALGIVTLEDSLEQIVGDIDDEFDNSDETMYQQLPDGTFRMNARIEIAEMNAMFPLELASDTFETLGGFLLAQFRRIPAVGESTEYHGFVFTIEEATDRAILWVHVAPPAQNPPA